MMASISEMLHAGIHGDLVSLDESEASVCCMDRGPPSHPLRRKYTSSDAAVAIITNQNTG